MLRTLCAAALALCALATVAYARPVDAFSGDRYSARPATFARDVTDAVAKQRAAKRAKRAKRHARPAHIRAPYRPPQMMVPPPADRQFDVRGQGSISSPLASIAGRYLGTNPIGWGHVWCGAFLRMVVRSAGLADLPGGNIARAWARYGSPAGPVIGAIGVLAHHVGIVLGRCANGSVLMRSGNHGHQVGDGCYSPGRFIAFRAAG